MSGLILLKVAQMRQQQSQPPMSSQSMGGPEAIGDPIRIPVPGAMDSHMNTPPAPGGAIQQG